MDEAVHASVTTNCTYTTSTASTTPSSVHSTVASACRREPLARHALALAVAMVVATPALGQSLSLGRLLDVSPPGQPLRAEIEVLNLSEEDASTLRPSLAPPTLYGVAGLPFPRELGDVRMVVERRQGERAVLRVTGDQPVRVPLVDLIVQLDWASGRTRRVYTVPIVPASGAPPSPAVPAAAPVPPPPAVAARTAPAPAASPPVAPPPAQAALPPSPAVVTPPPSRTEPPATVRVRRGNTLYGIASRYRPDDVSVERMMLGMFEGNPEAFIRANMNLLRAGAVLRLPGAENLAEVDEARARQTLVAHTADFDAYRRRLAAVAPVSGEAPSRRASGVVTPQAEAGAADALPSDRLTLSRAADVAQAAAVSQQAALDAATQREREVARNLEQLRRLREAALVPPAAASAPAAPGGTASAGAASNGPAANQDPAAAAALAAVGLRPASQVGLEEEGPPRPPPSTMPVEAGATLSGWLARVGASPWTLPSAALLVAALAAWPTYVWWRRRRLAQTSAETSEEEQEATALQDDAPEQAAPPEEDAAAAAEAAAAAALEPLPLDDPKNQAERYLAGGMDWLAEEALVAGMEAQPSRTDLPLMLMRMHAHRGDAKAFEEMALAMLKATEGGRRDPWSQVASMGRALDPGNPLYGQSAEPQEVETSPERLAQEGGDDGILSLRGATAPPPWQATTTRSAEAPEGERFGFERGVAPVQAQDEDTAARAVPAAGPQAVEDVDERAQASAGVEDDAEDPRAAAPDEVEDEDRFSVSRTRGEATDDSSHWQRAANDPIDDEADMARRPRSDTDGEVDETSPALAREPGEALVIDGDGQPPRGPRYIVLDGPRPAADPARRDDQVGPAGKASPAATEGPDGSGTRVGKSTIDLRAAEEMGVRRVIDRPSTVPDASPAPPRQRVQIVEGDQPRPGTTRVVQPDAPPAAPKAVPAQIKIPEQRGRGWDVAEVPVPGSDKVAKVFRSAGVRKR